MSNSIAVNQDWTQLPCVVAIIALGYSLEDIETVVNNLKIKGVSGEWLILHYFYLLRIWIKYMISINELILQSIRRDLELRLYIFTIPQFYEIQLQTYDVPLILFISV